MKKSVELEEKQVSIWAGDVRLDGNRVLAPGVGALVLFAHGSGSSRHSPRNRFVAGVLQEGHLGTLLFDLLSPEEEQIDLHTGQLRFDIGFLARRLVCAMDWAASQPETKDLRLGLFGSSTGAAAALVAAAFAPAVVGYLIAGHRSSEPGAAVALEHLGLEPVIDLGLRLGEGTGAALAVPTVQAAAKILREMATFDSAGVTDKDATSS